MIPARSSSRRRYERVEWPENSAPLLKLERTLPKKMMYWSVSRYPRGRGASPQDGVEEVEDCRVWGDDEPPMMLLLFSEVFALLTARGCRHALPSCDPGEFISRHLGFVRDRRSWAFDNDVKDVLELCVLCSRYMTLFVASVADQVFSLDP